MSDKKSVEYRFRKSRLELYKKILNVEDYNTLSKFLEREDYRRFDFHIAEAIQNQESSSQAFKQMEVVLANDEKLEEWNDEETQQDVGANPYHSSYWSNARYKELEEENNNLNNALQNFKKNADRLITRIDNLQSERKEKDEIIGTLNAQVTELRGKVQQNRIDEKIPGYVDGVKEKLDKDDNYFIKMSNRWAIAGGIAAVAAIVSAFITFFVKVNFTDITATELIYIFTRGLLGIALLSWLSLVCFSNSKKYTHESIRRKDRQHALMFGKIFLQIYGSTATKEDAINVFKDWNMSGDSAFSDTTESPPGVHNIINSALDKLSPKDKT